MAGDTVTTLFGGDDSAFAAAANRVKSAMGGIASFQPEMRFFEAGAKGAHGLGVAAHGAAGGIHAITGALAPLGAALAVLAGVGSIFAAFKESIESASRFETAKFNFEGIAGGADNARSAIDKLKEAGHETATGFGALSGAARILIEAGMGADEAADATERLNKIALNTGGSLEELAEIYGRITIKQEISQKDLDRLAMSGIPGIAGLAAQFKELERSTADSNKAIEQGQKALERTFELNEKNIGGINSFASRIGIAADAFKGFANGMGGSTALAGQLGAGFNKIAGTLNSEFTDGLKQISAETGVSQSSLMEFAREGKLGYEDLIQAAARYRKEKEEKDKAAGDAQKLANENNLLEQQRGLVAQVKAAIEGVTSEGGIFATVTAFFETWKGKLQELDHAIGAIFKNFGTPLMDALKPAVEFLTAQTPAIQQMAKEAGEALGGAIKWIIESLKDGTFWTTVQAKGTEAFEKIFQPVKELGARIQAAFAGMSQNKELVQGLQSISKLLDGIADSFGIRLTDALSRPLRALAEFDVSGREKADASWLSKMPGMPKLISPEEQGLTHEERVAREFGQMIPSKGDRDAAARELQEGMEGIKTHFPAAVQQGIEGFQTSPDKARAQREFDADVKAGRSPYFVRPDVAARDYERATGQKQPDWMSGQTAERVAQLLEQQNSLLRIVMTASGGG